MYFLINFYRRTFRNISLFLTKLFEPKDHHLFPTLGDDLLKFSRISNGRVSKINDYFYSHEAFSTSFSCTLPCRKLPVLDL